MPVGDLDDDDDIDVIDLHFILESFRCSSSCGDEDLNTDGVVDEIDLDIVVTQLSCGDDNQDNIKEAMREIGLKESDWDAMVDSFGTEDEDNYVCWMIHYVVCDPFCEHTLATCPGSDPY